jgi:hypothetical protein
MEYDFFLTKNISIITKDNLNIAINPTFLFNKNNPNKIKPFHNKFIKECAYIICDSDKVYKLFNNLSPLYATIVYVSNDKTNFIKKNLKKLNISSNIEYFYVVYIENNPFSYI